MSSTCGNQVNSLRSPIAADAVLLQFARVFKMENVEVAPFRSLDDFILESARFQVPDIKDPNRVANRIINNLLYYQTNYFLLTVIAFLLVG